MKRGGPRGKGNEPIMQTRDDRKTRGEQKWGGDRKLWSEGLQGGYQTDSLKKKKRQKNKTGKKESLDPNLHLRHRITLADRPLFAGHEENRSKKGNTQTLPVRKVSRLNNCEEKSMERGGAF